MVQTPEETAFKLTAHEAICGERYNAILSRISRLEMILVSTAGLLICGLASVLITILLKTA